MQNTKTLSEKNFDRLLKIIPNLESKLKEAVISESEFYLKLKSEPFMDLVFEYKNSIPCKDGSVFYVISLAHYYEQNGDLMSDPYMEIRIHFQRRILVPMLFEQSNPPIYKEVFTTTADGKEAIYPSRLKEQNSFLKLWLSNLIKQGFIMKD